MTLFVIAIVTVLVVSALCSLSEAALYSVRMPYIRQLVDSGSRAGQVLSGFKKDMDRPITAILIVNTAANTAGASVAGAQARLLFGDASLVWFSVLFTLSVLFFSEIVPKVAGVTYRGVVSPRCQPASGLPDPSTAALGVAQSPSHQAAQARRAATVRP